MASPTRGYYKFFSESWPRIPHDWEVGVLCLSVYVINLSHKA